MVCCQVFHPQYFYLHRSAFVSSSRGCFPPLLTTKKIPPHPSHPHAGFPACSQMTSHYPPGFERKKIKIHLEYWEKKKKKKGLLLPAKLLVANLPVGCHLASKKDFGEGVVVGENQSWCSASPSHMVCVLSLEINFWICFKLLEMLLCACLTPGEVGSRPGWGWMLFPRGVSLSGRV